MNDALHGSGTGRLDNLSVRRLGVTDAEAYRAIRLSALRTTPDAFGAVHAVEAARPLERQAERLETSLVFGAFFGARIVGLVGLRPEEGIRDGHKGQLWGLFVEPDCRARGVGGALMEVVLQAARGVVEQVTLSVVADNAAAITLYERLGFSRYGVEPRALRTADGYADEVLMVRFLN